MSCRRRTLARTLGVAAGLTTLTLAAVAPATAAPTSGKPGLVATGGHWAPADSAAIHPGLITVTKDASCTSNFIFTAGGHTYLGQAAHCSGTGEANETDGCKSKSLPLGTPVKIPDAGVTGKLAYNSWLLMQKVGETDEDACAFNDLALIEIPQSAVSKINPSIPYFGGPNGLNTTGTKPGDAVESYGNSPLRQGIGSLSPKTGTSTGDDGHGWTHTVYTATPGIPGDSGSAFLDSTGAALGVLSTLAVAPEPLSNQVSDLAHELQYARAHSDLKDLQVVAGTEKFNGSG